MHNTDSVIVPAIKAVAIGKRGSKSLEKPLIDSLIKELRTGNIPPAAKGAFVGALILKGLTEDEKKIEEAFAVGSFTDMRRLVEQIDAGANGAVKTICVQLLEGKTLDRSTAESLGDFLLSTEQGDALRGLAASILRVRYETPEEYEGILRSIHKTIAPAFRSSPPDGEPILQIAEPFDGVDHSNMITPLVAHQLQKENYRVVSLVGRNSGPKFGNNLLSVVEAIKGQFLKSSRDLDNSKPNYGWYLHQKDISPAVDRWVEIRHQTIKRPFMATLERFINPLKADIAIASAFHPPYGEKMLTIGEKAGFSGTIIIRNGIEGTLAFPLLRPVRILCSAKIKDGTFKRHEIIFDPKDHLKTIPAVEEKLTEPSLSNNKGLIEEYFKRGSSGNALFDDRVRCTFIGIRQGIKWIEENRKGNG